eukprot:Platyproteum_vivax@DN5311_c0_g1_i1.p1
MQPKYTNQQYPQPVMWRPESYVMPSQSVSQQFSNGPTNGHIANPPQQQHLVQNPINSPTQPSQLNQQYQQVVSSTSSSQTVQYNVPQLQTYQPQQRAANQLTSTNPMHGSMIGKAIQNPQLARSLDETKPNMVMPDISMSTKVVNSTTQSPLVVRHYYPAPVTQPPALPKIDSSSKFVGHPATTSHSLATTTAPPVAKVVPPKLAKMSLNLPEFPTALWETHSVHKPESPMERELLTAADRASNLAAKSQLMQTQVVVSFAELQKAILEEQEDFDSLSALVGEATNAVKVAERMRTDLVNRVQDKEHQIQNEEINLMALQASKQQLAVMSDEELDDLFQKLTRAQHRIRMAEASLRRGQPPLEAHEVEDVDEDLQFPVISFPALPKDFSKRQAVDHCSLLIQSLEDVKKILSEIDWFMRTGRERYKEHKSVVERNYELYHVQYDKLHAIEEAVKAIQKEVDSMSGNADYSEIDEEEFHSTLSRLNKVSQDLTIFEAQLRVNEERRHQSGPYY